MCIDRKHEDPSNVRACFDADEKPDYFMIYFCDEKTFRERFIELVKDYRIVLFRECFESKGNHRKDVFGLYASNVKHKMLQVRREYKSISGIFNKPWRIRGGWIRGVSYRN